MTEPGSDALPEPDHPEVRAFWDLARFHAKLNAAPTYFGPTTLESVPPPAWSFGETAEEADSFLFAILRDEVGETSAPLEDYGDELPVEGVLSILCDGAGQPRALLETTGVGISNGVVTEWLRVVYAGD